MASFFYSFLFFLHSVLTKSRQIWESLLRGPYGSLWTGKQCISFLMSCFYASHHFLFFQFILVVVLIFTFQHHWNEIVTLASLC